jgi:hypothetical protein
VGLGVPLALLLIVEYQAMTSNDETHDVIVGE